MSVPLIDAPDELTVPPSVGGASQETYDQIQFWTTRGVVVRDIAGGRSEIDVERYLFTLEAVERWVSLGSEVWKYDVWHEINDITKQCPYWESDPVNPTDPETWETWGGVQHAPIKIGALWYRSNKQGTQGIQVEASKWKDFIDTPNTPVTGIVRMLTVEEFQDIANSQTP